MNEGRAWQFEWHNDAFFGSDNQFTSGFKFRLSSSIAADLDDTQGTPAIGKVLARRLLPDDRSLSYREIWAVGQNIQTPEKISIGEIILNDVPYLGVLGVSNSYVAFDEKRFTGFGLLLGWSGEAALGEESQEAAHKLTGSEDPKGWGNQLEFEPLINFYYTKKRKLWDIPGFSGSVTGDAALGNFFTYGQVGVDFIFGKAPGGFLYKPMPLGRGLDFDASLRTPTERYTYVSLTARTTGFAHAMPRDGNLFRNDNEWTENNTIDSETWVHQLVFGLHHERPRWGMHLNFWLSSDTIEDDSKLFPSEDADNSFGTLTFDFRMRDLSQH
ncbi:MAG: lipid A deacylase LpxR family protein [Pseudomonadales bacterium]|nr:lipid A deacylase LpxR family protein [Pseudomonadales bacterium]